jgi:predicted HAD superfamily Cof-like phosphohydrolase
VARKEHSKKSKKKIKKKISSTRPVAKSPVARAGTPIQSETEWDENDFKNTRVVQVIKNSKSSSPDFPKDFHSYHSEVQHAVYRMSDSYTMTKNRTKILLDALWTYGGFILQHKDSKKILAAAVVELEHQRTFPDDEDNDHECAIIHYHSPFNKNLRGLWHYMYKYMLRRDLVKKIKYVYYPTDPLSKLVLSPEQIQARSDFFRKYYFDVQDAPCGFGGGKFLASPGYKKLFGPEYNKGFFDTASMTVVGYYDIIEFYDLPYNWASVQWSKKLETHVFSYQKAYCAVKTCRVEDLPPALKAVKASNNQYEWERVLALHGDAKSGLTPMDLKVSGSSLLDDERCCSYDCIWKMLKLDAKYKDTALSAEMFQIRSQDHTQFQDLKIMSKKSKKDGEVKRSLQEIMLGHGYELRYLRDEEKKKVRKELLCSEVFSASRVGMFICNLLCVHGSDNHTVSVAKYANGSGMVYDSNLEDPKPLCVETLNQCLQTSKCNGFEMVVEMVKQRGRK